MKKLILFLIIVSVFISCSNKEKQRADYLISLESEFKDSIESNSNKIVTNKSALLDIELLSTKSEYNKKVKQLVRSNKLNYMNGHLVYKFDLDQEIGAFGVIRPNYYKEKLYQLEVIIIMSTKDLDNITPPHMKTALMLNLFEKKYSSIYKKFIFDTENINDLRISWVGDGKEIKIYNGIITYTALSLQKELNAKKELELNNRIKDL